MALAVHITAPPPYQPPHIVGRGAFDGLDKRQQLTFSSCGLQCASDDFCQGYRTNFGFCCPTSVLTRTAFNYCGPATTCIEWGVSTGVQDFFFDSTSSIQYCGSARPSCVTYVYRNDDFTQVFCASNESGTSFFETTSTRQQSATFIGRTTSSEETTTPATSAPTATVIPNTRTNPTTDPTNTSTSTDPPTNSPTGNSSSGLSTGAVAGIGVGAALAGVGAAIGAFFLWRRSSKKKKEELAGGSGNQNFAPPPPPPPPPMANHQQGYNNTGYYQDQQPYAQVPQVQGYQAELPGAGTTGAQEYYKGTYPPPQSAGGVPPPHQPPPHQPHLYELGGGGGQAQTYQGNPAPHLRQEMQG